MCLILFAWQTHHKYKLILGANRDEFLARSTQRMHIWESPTQIVAGKDLERGGTWLGINHQKQFSALTNFREPLPMPIPNQPSRGDLVTGCLSGSHPRGYLEAISPKASEYGGFNLLAGDAQSLYHFSNREGEINEVPPGIHGLSNALLNTNWPKVEAGKLALGQLVAQSGVEPEKIFELLKNDAQAPEADLPQTGVSLEWEKRLSPLFIQAGNYGTRCSTVILWNYNDQISIMERTYDLVQPKTEAFHIA